jgi:glc operon protein GlcG
MSFKTMVRACLALALSGFAAIALAQVPQYGSNVTQDQAKKLLAAAEANARSSNLPMAIAIVDTAGMLVAFTKMDNTQYGSVRVSQEKAVSAAQFRRPTKAFQDGVAGGGAGLRLLTLGVSAVEGGLPITVDGKIIGAIGVSGGSAEQDGVVAAAGLAGLK